MTVTTGELAISLPVSKLADRIRGEGYPDTIEILQRSRQLFTDAVAAYQEYADHELTVTDAMTVALDAHHDMVDN